MATEALFVVDPAKSLKDSSTFRKGSFQLTNNSTTGQKITRILIDASSAILPDLVFDPFGDAGDTDHKKFQVNDDPGVGLTSFDYLSPHDGGFDQLEINFNDFDPGELFTFSIDMDPTSTKGMTPPGFQKSGSVSGLELVGAEITIEFDDGSILTGQTYRIPGSESGSQVVIKPNLPTQPSIEVLGVTGNTAAVSDPNQVIRVSGPVGTSVALLVIEGGFFEEPGVPVFDPDPFEANSAIAVDEKFATIGANGFVDIPVTLTDSNSAGGLNYFTAVIQEPDGTTGPTSSVIVLDMCDGTTAPDTTPPVATLTADDLTVAGGSEYSFTVDYADVSGVDETTTDVNDVTVVGTSSSLIVTNAVDNSNGSVTYTVAAPGGDWDIADNDTYQVTLQTGEVADTLGNAVSETALGSFDVSISTDPPVDTTPPAANLSAADITVSGGTDYSFDVAYTDASGVDFTTLDINDVTVLGPAGALTVTGITVDEPSGTATYTVAAPGGDWDIADNDTYQVTLQTGEVADTLGNAVSETALGSFDVSISTDPPVDTTPPAANLSAADITVSGGTDYSFDVAYTDASGVDFTTLDINDVTVLGPAGALTVTGITVDEPSGTATYTVAAPGGDWDIVDNGSYQVTLQTGEVADTLANAVSETTLGSFDVSISAPPPPGSTFRIEAEDYRGGVNDANGGDYYDSTTGNNGGAFRSDDVDIQATQDAGGGFNIGWIQKGEFLKYDFNLSEAGTYDVVVRAATVNNKLKDRLQLTINGQQLPAVAFSNTGGNQAWQDFIIPGVILNTGPQEMVVDMLSGGFNLNYVEFRAATPDNEPPAATLDTSSLQLPIGSNNDASFTIQYSDNVAVDFDRLDSADIQVTGPNGPLTVAFNSAAPSADDPTLTATYTIAAPSGGWQPSDNGTYTANVVAGQVFDTSDNELAPQSLGSFTVTVADPPVALGVPDIVALEDSANTVIDLYAAFEDAQDPDSALTYEIVSNTNPGLFASNPTINQASGELTLDYAASATGQAEIVVRATDTDGVFAEALPFFVTVVSPQQPDGVIRINAGGGDAYDASGNLFQNVADLTGVVSFVDNAGDASTLVVDNATPIGNTLADTTTPTGPVTGDSLYQTHRQGNDFSYEINVPNGSYNINFHFVEPEFDDFGLREFDIEVEGQTVFDDIDVYATIKNAFLDGINTARILQAPPQETFTALVNDGTLNIDFTGVLNEATIAALEIVPTPASVIVQESDGNSSVNEQGPTSDDYTVVLGTAPTSNVTVNLSFNSAQLSPNQASLTFTPSNWDTPQTVLVSAVDDSEVEGIHVSSVSHTATSSDPTYNNIEIPEVSFTIQDNDNGASTVKFAQQTSLDPKVPTTGAWGPDGRLYIGSFNGVITAYEFDGDYNVISETEITTIKDLDNNDILGIAFNPFDTDPANPRIYVSHSSLYFNGGSPPLETASFPYSGEVSVLEGPDFATRTSLVNNLPVSNHDHGINGLEFDNNGDLYIAVGGNTNAGITDDSIGGLDESPFTAAIVKAEITKPDFNGQIEYELPAGFQPPAGVTLEEAAQSQVFGGEANVKSGVDVEVYSAGFRNPFDLALTTQGQFFATENGANPNFGDISTGPDTQEPFSGGKSSDELLLLSENAYYGFANRNRGRTDNRQNYYISPDEPFPPSYLPPGAETDPNFYTAPFALYPKGGSNNGIFEYRSNAFGGELRGNIFVQRYNKELWNIDLSADGSQVDDIVDLNGVSIDAGGDEVASGLDILLGPGGAVISPDYIKNTVTISTPDDPNVTSATIYDIFPWRSPIAGGGEFVIGGVNFDPGAVTEVYIGDVEVTGQVSVSATRIEGLLPNLSIHNNDGLLDLRVINGGQESIIPDAFLPL